MEALFYDLQELFALADALVVASYTFQQIRGNKGKILRIRKGRIRWLLSGQVFAPLIRISVCDKILVYLFNTSSFKSLIWSSGLWTFNTNKCVVEPLIRINMVVAILVYLFYLLNTYIKHIASVHTF